MNCESKTNMKIESNTNTTSQAVTQKKIVLCCAKKKREKETKQQKKKQNRKTCFSLHFCVKVTNPNSAINDHRFACECISGYFDIGVWCMRYIYSLFLFSLAHWFLHFHIHPFTLVFR